MEIEMECYKCKKKIGVIHLIGWDSSMDKKDFFECEECRK